jgi:type III restriction enzyme
MSDLHEVEQPIINDAYEEPTRHWLVREGERPQLVAGRREAGCYYRPPSGPAAGTTSPSDVGTWVPLEQANRLREAVKRWREDGYPGCSRVTSDLLWHWNDPERERRLFFCQREAAETVIFLVEARADYRQGIDVPLDEPGPEGQAAGYKPFRRYACKMATGTGKTTVMAMLIAWSILNKVADRTDKRFSDTVLVVCPNVTIREQLARALDPNRGEESLYRARDLVPPDLMDELRRARVIVTNWHAFNPQDLNRVGQDGARVVKRGIESDAALIRRVLGEAAAHKQNILVINDEAHHAYRRGVANEAGNAKASPDNGEREEAERRNREATVWIGGLDKLHKERSINFCVDLSATPFYLVGTGNEAGRPFPWVVSDFGLIDAIESGIVKIPQLPVQDTTGAPIPAYFNVWKWIVDHCLTPGERGGRRGQIKPEAILRYAQQPLAQLAGLWRETFQAWQQEGRPVPPVFIVVCRDTALAQVVYEWLSRGGAVPEFANEPGREYTVRIDSKVVESIETGIARNDEELRLRYVLATVGKTEWPAGAPPEEWVSLCARWNARAREKDTPQLDPAVPPGRDVRCIVSVAMLTEGWDAANVTHIAGLRPFESQLLCEQVVGRGLRRTQYHDLQAEEVAQVYGVPFELIPFKARPKAPAPPKPVHHARALPERREFEIRFPRVEGYVVAVNGRITVDWDRVPPVVVDPDHIPDAVRLKGLSSPASGRLSLWGPGRPSDADLAAWRATKRMQELEFELAEEVTRRFSSGPTTQVPLHILFPQVLAVVRCFLRERVELRGRADRRDVFLDPYFSWAASTLLEAIAPDVAQGEQPELPVYERHRRFGSTADVDFWTSRPIWPTEKSHVSAVVADTDRWEQSAAFYLETSPLVRCYVKNDHLGFAIPYPWQGERHEYLPDFLVRLQDNATDIGTLILEVKGGRDDRVAAKAAGARRWVAAVNNDPSDRACGKWTYRLVRDPADVPVALADAIRELRSYHPSETGVAARGLPAV